MKLHAGLKYSTIFERVEKETGRKFMMIQKASIYEYDEKNKYWRYYADAFLDPKLIKKEKQKFIDNL